MRGRLGDSPAEEELFTSISLSAVAAVITDSRLPDNPIVAVNEAFCRLTGYPSDEVIGRNCRFLAGPATERDAQAVLRRAVREGRPALTQLLNYRKDGTPFRNAVMIAPVFAEDGGVAYFLGSQMDVGDDKEALDLRRRDSEVLIAGLTARQRQVLANIIAGYRNKQIAGFLGIDEKTVKMHRASLLARLGVRSSAQAVRIGVEAGLELQGPGRP